MRNINFEGRPVVADLIAAVAFEMGVVQREIVGPWRGPPAFRARMAVTWLAVRVTKHSLKQIGQAMGGRDRSTIIHQRERAEGLRQRDLAFRLVTDKLLARFEPEVRP